MSFGLWPRKDGRPADGGGASGGRSDGARNAVPDDALDPGSFTAVSCALEIAARQIARQVVALLTPALETKGLLAVVTASPTGAAVLAAARQLGNLQFPVSGIILGSLEFGGDLLGDEIRRCRAFKIPLRECQNTQEMAFVLQFPGLRLVAVDLHEEVTRHSELRDSLLNRPCVDLWSLRTPMTVAERPWIEQVGVPAPTVRPPASDWYQTPAPEIAGARPDFQPLLSVAELPPPAAPVAEPGAPVAAAIDGWLERQWRPLMKYITPTPVSRETARLLDSRAIREFHLTGLRMMELAAFQAAEVAALMARPGIQSADRRVAIICGRGNNGGDGFVVARYLAAWGYPVEIYILGEREKIFEDALINLRRADRLAELLRATHDRPPTATGGLVAAAPGDLLTPGWRNSGPTERFVGLPGIVPSLEVVELTASAHLAQNTVALEHAALIVDAVLGTGMVGEVRGLNREAIEWMNSARVARVQRGESTAPVPVLALDSPSGIDASTGAVLGAAVQADVTVTFGAPKIAFSAAAPNPTGKEFAGLVHLVEIGWPPVKTRGW